MAHGDSIVDGNGVELSRNAAGFTDGTSDNVPDVLEMHMAGNELRVGVRDGDDGLVKVAIF